MRMSLLCPKPQAHKEHAGIALQEVFDLEISCVWNRKTTQDFNRQIKQALGMSDGI